MSLSSSPTPATGAAARDALPTKMRAAVAPRYGDADGVEVCEVDVPTPRDGEILVRVEASSANALDWHLLTGTPHLVRMVNGVRRPKRTIHGADVAGVVVARGAGATKHAVGDAVFGGSAGGGFGEFLTVSEDNLVAKPAAVSFDDAAATPVAGLTALQGLVTHGSLVAGERVLINGAAGGVGTYAVQIARSIGAVVSAVCSGRNVEMVQRLGATEVFAYDRGDDAFDGERRFDLVLDAVGNRTPAELLGVLRPGGRVVAISGPKENRLLGPVPHILRMALACKRAKVPFKQFTSSTNAADLSTLADLLECGEVVPEIDRVVGLDGVRDALTEIGTGHSRSKIVVKPT